MVTLSIAALCLLAAVEALPNQRPFHSSGKIINKIQPLKHLSAISPFYVPTSQPDPLPPGCSLESASVLIRHSAILGNDDEYEQTMGPFIEKIKGWDKDKLPIWGDWSFLRDWKSPLDEDELEELSDRGKRDAKFLGKYFRQQYGSLFPDPGRHAGKNRPTYKVWTASSQRDIDSAKSYILGSFPSHQAGDHGEGDGDVVQLIKVPNKARDWDRSLTPHKACDAFEKESSLEPANKWLAVYAARIRERLGGEIPELAPELSDQDILAMQMLCGYESIAIGSSPFCDVFTDDEWRDVEYYMDIRWFYAIGYGSDLSPYLGLPWVKTAAHLLEGDDAGDTDHEMELYDTVLGELKKDKHKLPKPKVPPNATHTQLLHPSFTHRESPAFVAVFLNLYNSSSLAHPASEIPPLDHRIDDRAWRTSHLISFLGHVSLERFKCTGKEDSKPHGLADESMRPKPSTNSFVRAVVNGKAEVMTDCEDGPDGSCKWATFRRFVDDRVERYGDWESVCDK